MEVQIPFSADTPTGYRRSRVLLRRLPEPVMLALHHVRDQAIAEGLELADGAPVDSPERALQFILEAVASAAEE